MGTATTATDNLAQGIQNKVLLILHQRMGSAILYKFLCKSLKFRLQNNNASNHSQKVVHGQAEWYPGLANRNYTFSAQYLLQKYKL